MKTEFTSYGYIVYWNIRFSFFLLLPQATLLKGFIDVVDLVNVTKTHIYGIQFYLLVAIVSNQLNDWCTVKTTMRKSNFGTSFTSTFTLEGPTRLTSKLKHDGNISDSHGYLGLGGGSRWV